MWVRGDRERCDHFVEYASIGSVYSVEEKVDRGISMRQWRTLDEFGEKKSVLERIETRSDDYGLNLLPLVEVLVFIGKRNNCVV